MKVNSLSWAASDNLKQVRTSMNETGARVHEVRLLLVCIVECSGSGRDDMDGCLLPASEWVWCLLCMRCLSATSRWYGLMFVAVSSYVVMWGDVVVDGIVLMCRYAWHAAVTSLWYGGCLLPASWCGVMLLCTRLIVMLLIAEVDCHDVDHVLKLSSYIWLDCFRGMVMFKKIWKNHPLKGKKFTVVAKAR